MVASKDGFWLSGAILLGMALVVGIAQPFERPQVNALQTSCFACAWAVEKPLLKVYSLKIFEVYCPAEV